MPGLDVYGVKNIKHVISRPREKEALKLLEKIADQVHPICAAHKWNVQMLEEFVPPNAGLLGMNVNRNKIFIRLRPASDVGSFYPYEALLHTMLHELVHMEIGPHSAKFYKMLDELRDECEKLMREGITGRNMPFAGSGTQLGGGRTAVDARAAALKAAEKRQRQQGVMGGGHRLGGSSGASGGSAAERAAAAAEWRVAVSRGCAATNHGASSQADGGCGGHGGRSTGPRRGDGDGDGAGGGDDGWDCDLCTLHNSYRMAACDACGTPHDAPSGRSGGGSSSGGRTSGSSGGGGGGGGVGGGGGSSGGGSRPSNGVSNGKRPAGMAGMSQGLPSAASRAPYRASRGPTAAAAAADGGRSSSSNSSGRPAASTWTCRKCPFAFPNAAERRTCESCRAARQAEEGVAATGAATRAGDAGTARLRGIRAPSWECGRCTVVNPKDFLVCEACRAPKAFRPWAGAGAGGGSFAGPDAVGYQGGAWTGGSSSGGGGSGSSGSGSSGGGGNGGGGGSDSSGGGGGGSGRTGGGSGGIGVGGEDAVEDSSSRGRVCGVCTLRNPEDAFACAACGIPLAESEAATGAAAAAAAAVVASAATSTNGDGNGGLAGRHRDAEDDADDAESRRSVKSDEPEVVDLS